MRFPKRFQVIYILAQLSSMLLIPTGVYGSESEHQTIMNEIGETLHNIQRSGSVQQRTDFAMHLSMLIRKENPTNIDVDTIDEITALLRDRDDSVRYWAATSLGFLGPRAQRAVPALRIAL